MANTVRNGTNRTQHVLAGADHRNAPCILIGFCAFPCIGTAIGRADALRQLIRRVFRARMACLVGAVFLLTSPASADALDSSGVSMLIKSTVQEIGQPFPGVHILILDPADYARHGGAEGERVLDATSLVKIVDRTIAQPLDFVASRTIVGRAAFAFFNDEMLTSLHPLPDGSTLCVVFPLSAPLRLTGLAAWLSGADETKALEKIDFKVADFYRFLLYHEVAHCGEDPRRIWAFGLGAHDIYLAESRADAFAVLLHMKRTGDRSLPRFMVSIRRKGMVLRDDIEHQTAAVIEPAIAYATEMQLSALPNGTSLQDLMNVSRTLTRNHALSRADFEALGPARATD